MRLTFVNDMGQSFVIEIDPQMSLEDIMALLEAEVCASQQPNGAVLSNSWTCSQGFLPASRAYHSKAET